MLTKRSTWTQYCSPVSVNISRICLACVSSSSSRRSISRVFGSLGYITAGRPGEEIRKKSQWCVECCLFWHAVRMSSITMIGAVRSWKKIPGWFDEGLAVLVSQDPRYSDELLTTDGGNRAPKLEELRKRASRWQYGNWLISYGTARRAVA